MVEPVRSTLDLPYRFFYPDVDLKTARVLSNTTAQLPPVHFSLTIVRRLPRLRWDNDVTSPQTFIQLPEEIWQAEEVETSPPAKEKAARRMGGLTVTLGRLGPDELQSSLLPVKSAEWLLPAPKMQAGV
jgi:hypothetical protein